MEPSLIFMTWQQKAYLQQEICSFARQLPNIFELAVDWQLTLFQEKDDHRKKNFCSIENRISKRAFLVFKKISFEQKVTKVWLTGSAHNSNFLLFYTNNTLLLTTYYKHLVIPLSKWVNKRK